MSYWGQDASQLRPPVKPLEIKFDDPDKKREKKEKRKTRREEKKKQSFSNVTIIPLPSSKAPSRNNIPSKDSPSPKTDFDIFNRTLTGSSIPGSGEGAASSTITPDSSIPQKDFLRNVKQNENQYGESEGTEFDPGDPIHLMTGTTRVWRPPFWKEVQLITRYFQATFRGTLDELSKELTGKNIYRLEEKKFWSIFETTRKDDYWLSDEMSNMHDFRQAYKTITPLVIRIAGTSDLPFKLHLISMCEYDRSSGKIVFKMDDCNQSFYDDTNMQQVMPFMYTINPDSDLHNYTLVTDFRKQYSPDCVKAIFKIQREELKSCYSIQRHESFSVPYLKEGSHLHQIIYALSDSSNIAFSEIRPKAEKLLEDMSTSRKQALFRQEDMWFIDLDHATFIEVLTFIEQLTLTIPKYDRLCYKIQPVPGVEWTNVGTWSFYDIKRLGIQKLLMGSNRESGLNQLLEQKIFNVTLNFQLIYL